LVILSFACKHEALHFVIDSRPTVDRLQWYIENPAAARPACSNADWWRRVQQLLATRTAATSVSWVKSHLTPELYGRFSFPPLHVLGNAVADKLAEAAAKEARPGPDDTHRHRWALSAVRRIQQRLLFVAEQDLSGDAAGRREQKRARQEAAKQMIGRIKSIPGMAVMSQHRLASSSTTPAGVWCTACMFAPEPCELKQWLVKPCVRLRLPAATSSGPIALHGMSVLVSGRPVHASHKLHVHRGLFFCSVCGHYAGAKMQKLADVCSMELTPAGRTSLSRIRNDKLPSGLLRWPAGPSAGRRAIALGGR